MVRRSAILGFALALGLAGETRADTAPPSFANLSGESCHLAPRNDVTPDPSAPPAVYLYCGKAKHDSAAIYLQPLPASLPSEPEKRREILQKVSSSSYARRQASARMACQAGRWMAAGPDQDAYVETCSLVDGDWPYLQIALVTGKFIAQIEALPANVPAAALAASKLAETATPPAIAAPDPAKSFLTSVYGGKPPLVAATELDQFDDLAQGARTANSRNDFGAAEDSYRHALLILERAQSPESPGVGKALMELALEVSNQGRAEEAASLFRRADPIVQKSANPADQARFNLYLAYDAANAGRVADALTFARAASGQWRSMAESGGPSLDALGEDSHFVWRGELAHSLNVQASMALASGDLGDAEASAKEALEIIGDQKNLPPWWRPEILVTLGRVYAALGRLNEAEQSFRGALVLQQRLFGETAPTANTLLALSAVYADQGLYGDSLRAYDVAMKILSASELARSQIQFDQVAPLLISAGALAERTPATRADMNAKMFEGLQLLSGGVADQTIAKASARLAAQNPEIEKLVRGIQEANRGRDAARIELAHETSLPDDQRGSAKENALLAAINGWAANRDAQIKELSEKFPAYADLARPHPITLQAAQAKLAPKEALLIFEIGRSRAFTVLVTADKLLAKPLALNQGQVDGAVRQLRKAFAGKGGKLGDFDLAQSHALYKSLIGPVEKDLAGIDQLVLVESGSLASLPAALLVTAPPANETDYRRAAWLARRFATLEVPSIRAFVSLRDRPTAEAADQRPFLGIGNPAFVGAEEAAKGRNSLSAIATSCRGDGPFPAELLRSLTPLPDTATELHTVAKALHAGEDSLLLGKAATEVNVRKLPLDKAKVIYFATHALLPGELSCQSEPALALSPPETAAASRDTDGLLDASEVAGLTLHADLVVLSACNTGQSETQFGGGALTGLAEAFFYAGARSLIASHWQVPSGATAQMMVELFEKLTADPSAGAARAMRTAQLALMDKPETAHPFFWAAFTIIGDGGGARPAQVSER